MQETCLAQSQPHGKGAVILSSPTLSVIALEEEVVLFEQELGRQVSGLHAPIFLGLPVRL